MKQKSGFFFMWAMVVLALFAQTAHAAESKKKLKAVATIGQLADVVRNVAGDLIEVKALMGAGVDPHLYKASESDVMRLAEADIIFYNGLFLEAKMGEVFEKMQKSKKIVAVGESIADAELLGSIQFADHHDPHIWFDVTLWMQVVETVAQTLAESDPAHKDVYETNAQKYLNELKDLHAYVLNRAGELAPPQRVLVTAHDAFRYFGRQYGFEVLGLQGVSTETEAGAKDVMALADFIVERKIKAIFVESSVPERNIKAVRDAVSSRGWDVKIGGELFSDAMGTEGTFEGTYKGMVTHNIDIIVGALK